jgi:hypothetical protein
MTGVTGIPSGVASGTQVIIVILLHNIILSKSQQKMEHQLLLCPGVGFVRQPRNHVGPRSILEARLEESAAGLFGGVQLARRRRRRVSLADQLGGAGHFVEQAGGGSVGGLGGQPRSGIAHAAENGRQPYQAH